MDRRLRVSANGRTVGELREHEDLWQFEYAPAWAAAPDAYDLSPALARAAPLHVDGATHRPVQWYFDNLLPEDELRGVLAKEAVLSADDAFGLLAYYGAESAGSLVLLEPGTETPLGRGLAPLPLAELSRRIANLPHTSLGRDAPRPMSLAGAQHKLLVVYDGERLYEPLAGTPSTHTLKPGHPGPDYPAAVMNEYFTMRLARAAGLAVPDVALLFVPQPVYLVARFDRRRDPAAGTTERLHVIDACQLLNKSRAFKYTAADLAALREAAGLCRSRAAARLQLYRWLVFNLLVGNADNHLKNVSFLVNAGGINLAPAYDLLGTAAYDTRALANERAIWPATPLALSIGAARTFAEVTRTDVLAAARTLGLAEHTARRELDRLLKFLPAAAQALIADIQAHAAQSAEHSPDPLAARAHLGAGMRLLAVAARIVLPDMAARLA